MINDTRRLWRVTTRAAALVWLGVAPPLAVALGPCVPENAGTELVLGIAHPALLVFIAVELTTRSARCAPTGPRARNACATPNSTSYQLPSGSLLFPTLFTAYSCTESMKRSARLSYGIIIIPDSVYVCLVSRGTPYVPATVPYQQSCI